MGMLVIVREYNAPSDCLNNDVQPHYAELGGNMPDLTPDQVKTLAQALALDVADDDLVEVTHRLNVMTSSVERFTHPDLDAVDPVPFHPLEESVPFPSHKEENRG